MDNANAHIMLTCWPQCGANLAACGKDAGRESLTWVRTFKMRKTGGFGAYMVYNQQCDRRAESKREKER